MKWGYILSAFFLITAFPHAGQAQQIGEIVAEPICFGLVNSAPHSMLGTIRTDLYPTEEGGYARHTSNFDLDAADSFDKNGNPTDRIEFCSYGPFYEGRKLELVIRTLFPVFSCKTNIESGPIILGSTPKNDDPMGGYDYWAECYE